MKKLLIITLSVLSIFTLAEAKSIDKQEELKVLIATRLQEYGREKDPNQKMQIKKELDDACAKLKQLGGSSELCDSQANTPPFNYYVWFPKGADTTPDEIDKVKVWIFKDEGDYKQMMDNIQFSRGFKKGFGKGYGMVNKYTVALLPKAGKALEAASGETLAGLGMASQIAADLHTLFGEMLKPGIGFVVKEAKKKFKEVRIGYDGDLTPGEFYWKKAEDKGRDRVYLVITLGDDTRKELEGPVNKIDMYPLWQGYVQIPQGSDSLYMKVLPKKAMGSDPDGKRVPIYRAQVLQTTEQDFEAADPELSDKD